jgi:hypothetical protein
LFHCHTGFRRIDAFKPFKVFAEVDGNDRAVTDLLTPHDTDICHLNEGPQELIMAARSRTLRSLAHISDRLGHLCILLAGSCAYRCDPGGRGYLEESRDPCEVDERIALITTRVAAITLVNSCGERPQKLSSGMSS